MWIPSQPDRLDNKFVFLWLYSLQPAHPIDERICWFRLRIRHSHSLTHNQVLSTPSRRRVKKNENRRVQFFAFGWTRQMSSKCAAYVSFLFVSVRFVDTLCSSSRTTTSNCFMSKPFSTEQSFILSIAFGGMVLNYLVPERIFIKSGSPA